MRKIATRLARVSANIGLCVRAKESAPNSMRDGILTSEYPSLRLVHGDLLLHSGHRRSFILAGIGLAALLAAGGLPRDAGSEAAYIVRAWTPDDGLPTSTVQDIAQTPDGYLWVATTGGLARFDGVHFHTFGGSDSLPSSRFNALLVARDGTLFASTDDGWLCHWDGRRFTSVNMHLRLGWTSLLEGTDGSIFGAGGQLLWRVRAGATHVYADSTGFFPTIALDARGVLWVTLAGELPARLNGERLERIGPGAPGAGRWLTDPRTRKPVFFRASGRDAELLDTSLRRLAILAGAGADLPLQIDAQGRLWSSSGSDLVVRATEGGRVLQRYRLGLTEPALRLFLDADGDAWVGTWTQGLLRVSPSPLKLLRPPGLASALEIISSAQRLDGSVIATDLAENAWRAGETELQPVREGLWEIPGQGGWQGSQRTQYRLRTNSIELRDSSGRGGILAGPGRAFLKVVEDPDRPASVFALRGNLIVRVTAVGGTLRITPLLRPAQEVRDLFVDSRHRLWVSTMVGLWRLGPGDTTCFTRKDGLPVDHVRQIHEDADGTMWFGTYGGGLVRRRDERFATLDHRHGLLEDVVSVALEDDAGELWLAGNRGIQRISQRQANDCLDGRRTRVDAVSYGRESGLRNPEGSGQRGLRTSDGRLWFPTFDGLAVVDPRIARTLTDSPPIAHIEGVSAGDRAVPRGTRGFVLEPSEGRFDVHYTGFDPGAAEQLRFAYRLEGVDHDWIEAGGNRAATYTNVPPGRHEFRLMAYSGSGRASERADSVTIDVQPQFWETAWFRILAVLAAALAVATGLRVRDRRLRAHETELQRAVDARTAELAEEQQRAEQALVTVEAQAHRLEALDRARSRFFASISHEFRTPLTLIQGPLQDVRAGLHGPLPTDADEQVDIALDSAGRLHRLVDQLLDAARAEAGELKLDSQPRDLVEFLKQLAQGFAPLAERRRIAFTRRLPEGPVVAAFDREAMEKVFANLLGNAFKFTPEGGHVSLAAEPVGDGDGPAIEVAVSDDGPGIAPEDLPHVFKRFYRAERSITRVQPGTGLGLALAADMIEQHGGQIRVESREGHGSTFTVRLRRLPDQAAAPATADEAPMDAGAIATLADEIRVTPDTAGGPSDPPAPLAEHGPTILVVDDHPDVRAYVARHLRRRYRVNEAADGVQALASMRGELPDLVVSDVSMPEMDGHALVSAIRRDPELDFVPVVLLTAAASPANRIEGLEGGADDYLTKPFEMRELLARVAQALESRRRLRERTARAAAAASVYGTATPARGVAPAVSSISIAQARAAAIDSAFVRRMHAVIESRMGDEDFDVDRLAEAMGVGRTLLYEKVGELTDQTPMTLVMTYRLERAAQMLRAGEGNVGEVAYAVGFRSVSHFTRRFREQHGVTPSAWRRGEGAPALRVVDGSARRAQ